MSSFLDSLRNELGDDYMGQLGDQIGTDPGQAKGALDAALPELIDGLARNTRNREGAEALANALERDHDGSILENLREHLKNPDGGSGEGILRHVFGEKRGEVEQRLSAQTGLNVASAGKLLIALAPILLGFLGRAKKSGGMGPGDLGDLIGGASRGGGKLGCLAKLLPMLLKRGR